MRRITSIVAVSLVFAAVSGGFAAVAITDEAAPPATTTVTVDVKNGETGPTGPTGPAGPPGVSGEFTCPATFDIGELVINHPGGQVTIYGCIKEGTK